MRAKLGEYKMPVARGDVVKSVEVRGRKLFSPAVPSTPPTHGYTYFVLSPVSLTSRDQDGGPLDSTIKIYDLTEK